MESRDPNAGLKSTPQLSARPVANNVTSPVPVLFRRQLDAHQLSFAFSEVACSRQLHDLAGDLAWAAPDAGMLRAVLA
ncbi:hypothetical protein QBK99_21095 [Corticibacterium sp. UT-5YL-CI-8]|nr:hypothetical protein [Tianweitania sp. UT-5YL-CI-8]